jgi:hypothetical protein
LFQNGQYETSFCDGSGLNRPKGAKNMSAGDWKDLQGDIRNSLNIGQKNGETMIDVVTRIVWLERHKNQIRIGTLNEILRDVNGDPLPEKRP